MTGHDDLLAEADLACAELAERDANYGPPDNKDLRGWSGTITSLAAALRASEARLAEVERALQIAKDAEQQQWERAEAAEQRLAEVERERDLLGTELCKLSDTERDRDRLRHAVRMVRVYQSKVSALVPQVVEALELVDGGDDRLGRWSQEWQAKIEAAEARIEKLREVARDVVVDNWHLCDQPDACSCSFARLQRVMAGQG